MQTLRIGDRYPIDPPAAAAFVARVEGASFSVVGFAPNITAREVRLFKSNPLRYGVHVHRSEPPVPFFLVKIAGSDWYFDVPINIAVEPLERRRDFIDQPGNFITIILCEHETGIIKAIHGIGVKHETMDTIKQACAAQIDDIAERQMTAQAAAVNQAIDTCYMQLSLDDMIENTEMILL